MLQCKVHVLSTYSCIISAKVILGSPFPGPFPWNYPICPFSWKQWCHYAVASESHIFKTRIIPPVVQYVSSSPCLQRPQKTPGLTIELKTFSQSHLPFEGALIWYHQTKITTKINISIYPHYLALANHFAHNNTTSFLTMGQGTATVGLSCSISFQLKLASKSSITSEILKPNRCLFTSHQPFLA